MYEINLMFKNDDWAKHPWKCDKVDKVDAIAMAISCLEIALQEKPYQLLPVGVSEFIVWSQGSCVGFLSIKEVGPETSVQDLGDVCEKQT